MTRRKSSFETRHFASAVDGWFVLLAVGLPAMILAVVFLTAHFPDTRTLVLAVIASLLGLGLPVWLLFSTGYTVSAGQLRIHSGPFRWTVPLADIESVTPSRTLRSSPALSLDRLEIRYGKRKLVAVSPKDRDGFLRAIEEASQP